MFNTTAIGVGLGGSPARLLAWSLGSYLLPLLPLAGLRWDVVKAPEWGTLVHRAAAGREVRLSRRSAPLWHWKLSYEFLDDGAANTLQALMSFFNKSHGAAQTFIFIDPTDGAAYTARFDGDALDFDMFAFHLWEMKELKLVSVKS